MNELVDLHRHLDGSMRYETLVELADPVGVSVPPRNALVFQPHMGLAAALERFAMTLSALQTPDAVKRVAEEMCEDAETEHITTLEIRFAPQLHRGAAPEAIVDAALDGMAGRATLILCGLYGEPPSVLEDLARIAASRSGVVGLDLAGGPQPGADFGMAAYRRAFTRARDAGIGRTVHAGEGRPAAEIREAIELLHAQRIGHGCSLLDDDTIVDLVLDRGVTIEACPTSNVHTGAIDSVASHPLPRWLVRGVRVCVNTDNTLLSDVDIHAELDNVRAIPGMGDAQIAAVIAHGHAARFCR